MRRRMLRAEVDGIVSDLALLGVGANVSRCVHVLWVVRVDRVSEGGIDGYQPRTFARHERFGRFGEVARRGRGETSNGLVAEGG